MRSCYKYIFHLTALVVITALHSCTKEQEGIQVIGSLRLEITAKHHTWGVPYLPVYLKKNASVFPGEDTSLYEFSSTADNDGKVVFDKLHPGNYFLFTKGYDLIWGDTVTGRQPIALNSNTNIIHLVSE